MKIPRYAFLGALCLLASASLHSLDLIWSESFENSSSHPDSTYSPVVEFGADQDGHFTRTDDLSINSDFEYDAIDGSFFFSMTDIDDADGAYGADVGYIDFVPINTSGYINLKFSGLFGALQDNSSYNRNDWAWVAFSTDSGSNWTKGMQFNVNELDTGLGVNFDFNPFVDETDTFSNSEATSENSGTGQGGGGSLNWELSTFEFELPDADSIQLRFAAHFDNENEPFALDYFSITGTPEVFLQKSAGHTPVPEPGTFGLLGAGMLLITVILRRMKLRA